MLEGFGLFYLVTSFIGKAVWNTKQHNENKRCYQRTYNPKTGTYMDMYGAERKPNGEYCKTKRDIYSGDLVQRDINNNIVRNFSEEERIKEANRSDSTVLKMSEEDMSSVMPYGEVRVYGVRFKDKKTGEDFVIRDFAVPCNNRKYIVYFYMKVSSGELVRITDGERRYGELKDTKAINEFMNRYNQERRTRKYRIYEVDDKYSNHHNCNKDREPEKFY